MATETTPEVEVAMEEPEAWKRRLTITVPQERVRRARNRERTKLAKSARLKGFRKGKVPAGIIEERFGPLLEQRTVQVLLAEAYHQALDQRGLQPIGDPSFGDVQYDPDRSFTFQVELEVLPELHLERLGGFRIRRPPVEVSEEEVEEALGRLRKERGVWQPVERSPEDGDLVSVLIARLDEEGGAKPRPYRFEIGAGYAIPEVEAAIRTLSPGQAGEFRVSFPAEFDDPELAGATRTLRIEVQGVKERRLPELDDELASEVGEFDTLEELRSALREDLARHAESAGEEKVRDRLIDSIVEANPFEVPPAMVERYLDGLIEAPEGADPEQVATARDSLRPAAELGIKRQLILDTLAEREGLEATEEELRARIAELAERRGERPEELRRRLGREKRLPGLRRQITVEKVFEHLKNQSTVE
ncbi:MAG: trigger factor [Gemmatimonadota bacterium]